MFREYDRAPLQKSQSFMEMINSAKTSNSMEEDEESMSLKKESSSTQNGWYLVVFLFVVLLIELFSLDVTNKYFINLNWFRGFFLPW